MVQIFGILFAFFLGFEKADGGFPPEASLGVMVDIELRVELSVEAHAVVTGLLAEFLVLELLLDKSFCSFPHLGECVVGVPARELVDSARCSLIKPFLRP